MLDVRDRVREVALVGVSSDHAEARRKSGKRSVSRVVIEFVISERPSVEIFSKASRLAR